MSAAPNKKPSVALGLILILLLLALTVIKKITSSKEEEIKAGA